MNKSISKIRERLGFDRILDGRLEPYLIISAEGDVIGVLPGFCYLYEGDSLQTKLLPGDRLIVSSNKKQERTVFIIGSTESFEGIELSGATRTELKKWSNLSNGISAKLIRNKF